MIHKCKPDGNKAMHWMCRAEKAITKPIKYFCYKCNRYVTEDGKHSFMNV